MSNIGHKKVTPNVMASVMRGSPPDNQLYITESDGTLKKVECVAMTEDGGVVISCYADVDASKAPLRKIFSDVYQIETAEDRKYYD